MRGRAGRTGRGPTPELTVFVFAGRLIDAEAEEAQDTCAPVGDGELREPAQCASDAAIARELWAGELDAINSSSSISWSRESSAPPGVRAALAALGGRVRASGRFGPCALCAERLATVVMEPCGHVAACASCAARIPDNGCIWCRKIVLGAHNLLGHRLAVCAASAAGGGVVLDDSFAFFPPMCAPSEREPERPRHPSLLSPWRPEPAQHRRPLNPPPWPVPPAITRERSSDGDGGAKSPTAEGDWGACSPCWVRGLCR